MHSGGQNQLPITNPKEFDRMMAYKQKVMVAAGIQDINLQIMSDIYSGWQHYLIICTALDISPTMQDFKNLVTVSCLKHAGS